MLVGVFNSSFVCCLFIVTKYVKKNNVWKYLLTDGSNQSQAKLMNASNMALPTSSSWSIGHRKSNSSAVQSSTVLDPTSPGISTDTCKIQFHNQSCFSSFLMEILEKSHTVIVLVYVLCFQCFDIVGWASGEKVRHFSTFFPHFGLPGYAPRTIAVNVTWIEREFNAGQTPRSTWFSIADARKKLTQEKRARWQKLEITSQQELT